MSVSITWTQSGVSTTSVNYGTVSGNSHSAYQTISISHNGVNPLTNCKLYLTSQVNHTADLAEILKWGDSTISGSFGGLAVNFNPSGLATWPTISSKYSTTSGHNYNTFRTGAGDTTTDGIILSSANQPLLTGNGIIPSTVSGLVYLSIMMPTSGVVLGARNWNLGLSYTYTS